MKFCENKTLPKISKFTVLYGLLTQTTDFQSVQWCNFIIDMELSMPGEKNFVDLDQKPADLVLHHFLKKVKKKFCKQCTYYIGQIWWFCLARPKRKLDYFYV